LKQRWPFLALIFSALLLISSCRTTSFFKEEPYFSAMGEPSHLVITMDMQKGRELLGDQSLSQDVDPAVSQLLDRTDRISISLYDPNATEEERTEKVDLSAYAYFGGLEGNYPRFITNTALLWSPGWEKIENDKTHYFTNDMMGLYAAVPKSGLLLFSNSDYMEAYEKTYAHRTTLIDASSAAKMQKAMFGFYANSPQAMIDIGLDIPLSVLLQMNSILFVIESSADGNPILNGTIVMKNAKLANSLNILLKTSYISEKRRNKLPLGDLTNLFILNEDAVEITGMALSQAQLAGFSRMFDVLFQTAGGSDQHANL